MRSYRYEATEETIAALRLLRGAWTGIRVEPGRVTVRLADAREVRLEVDSADPEPGFEAFRISAAVEPDKGPPSWQGSAPRPPFGDTPDFAVGRNDVVLFAGATWIEGDAAQGVALDTMLAAHADDPAARPLLGGNPVLQMSGHPGQISETATAVCLTTDAVLAASPVGTGFLIRTGLQPYSLEVSHDPVTLELFLRERNYIGR